METDKKILDACCGSRMCWFDKGNPDALFLDCRSEEQIKVRQILDIIPYNPLFGHPTGRSGKTLWMCFMKN